jgi:hypothetical protein
VEAEGHGPRAYRVDPQPAVAQRRHGAWTQAAQLRVCVSAEEADGRVAFGHCSEDCDGKFTVVESFEVAEAKTKLFRAALDKLEAGKTTLLVETSRKLDEKLYLGSRNLRASSWCSAPRCIPTICCATSTRSSRRMRSSAAGDAEEVCFQAQQGTQQKEVA